MEEVKELEIGEYVRTKKGTFDIVTEGIVDIGVVRCKKTKYWLEDIVKHGKNIRDLIQAGDIVVYKIKGLEHSLYIDIVKEYTDARTLKSKLRVAIYSLEQLDIKQILTKEKFKNESYKVEEGQDV